MIIGGFITASMILCKFFFKNLKYLWYFKKFRSILSSPECFDKFHRSNLFLFPWKMSFISLSPLKFYYFFEILPDSFKQLFFLPRTFITLVLVFL